MSAALVRMRVPANEVNKMGVRLFQVLGGITILVLSSAAVAQTPQPAPVQQAEADKPSPPVDPRTGTPNGVTDSNAATQAEIQSMEKRIERLEQALAEERARNLADTDATSALKAAERQVDRLQHQGEPIAMNATSVPAAAGTTPSVAPAQAAEPAPAKDPHAPAFAD